MFLCIGMVTSLLLCFCFSTLRVISVLDYTHERVGNKRGGDCNNEFHHSCRGYGDAAASRYVSRPDRKFQSELTNS